MFKIRLFNSFFLKLDPNLTLCQDCLILYHSQRRRSSFDNEVECNSKEIVVHTKKNGFIRDNQAHSLQLHSSYLRPKNLHSTTSRVNHYHSKDHHRISQFQYSSITPPSETTSFLPNLSNVNLYQPILQVPELIHTNYCPNKYTKTSSSSLNSILIHPKINLGTSISSESLTNIEHQKDSHISESPLSFSLSHLNDPISSEPSPFFNSTEILNCRLNFDIHGDPSESDEKNSSRIEDNI